ncbi:MAG: glycosyl transferase, partial [Endozoicomonadaceae bacterium]|nr:glycosyl transferase [Endozoicomonadaceae bacterium]
MNYQIIKSSEDWEKNYIKKYHIEVWINDRLDTDYIHAINVTNTGTKLVTFDDYGTGSKDSDLHIAALPFLGKYTPKGKKVLKGLPYLILNPEILNNRRYRQNCNKYLVTMGGTDTYGVTIKVLNILNNLGKTATVILGPGFQHQVELSKFEGNASFDIKQQVPSLINEFLKFDCVI